MLDVLIARAHTGFVLHARRSSSQQKIQRGPRVFLFQIQLGSTKGCLASRPWSKIHTYCGMNQNLACRFLHGFHCDIYLNHKDDGHSESNGSMSQSRPPTVSSRITQLKWQPVSPRPSSCAAELDQNIGMLTSSQLTSKVDATHNYC